MTLHERSRNLLGFLALVLPVLGTPQSAAANIPRPPVEVEVPALIMVESTAWLHASWEGVEVLSLAPEEATRTFVQNIAVQRANLAAILPEDFRITWSRPISIVLYSVENPRPMPGVFGPILSKKFTEKERAEALENREGKPLDVIVSPKITPGTWVVDADSVCVFNLVPARVKGSDLSTLPAVVYVAYLMHARMPPLPTWFIDGISMLIGPASVNGTDLDLPPYIWISPAQTQLLVKDRSMPVEFLPLSEIFTHVNAATEPKDDHKRQISRSQAGLFVRWAFEGKAHGGAQALWKFARGPTTGSAGAAHFAQCFGQTPEAALESMRAYLQTAIRKPARLRLARDGRLPPIELRPATISEIARIKGEWERLSGRFVSAAHPELWPFYSEQASRTLALGPDNATADPELLAARALLAVEKGDEVAALPLLEAACATERPRPRAVVELARLRLAAAKAALAPDTRLTPAAAEALVAPLRSALESRPPMARGYQVLAETWLATDGPPPPGDVELILRGARSIPGDATLIVPAARLFLDIGRVDAAGEVVELALAYTTDDAGRRRLFALRSAVRAASAK